MCIKNITLFSISFTLFIFSCVLNTKILYAQDIPKKKIYAWCIVQFDSLKRSPAQRIDMLKQLGIKNYAYEYSDTHLNSTVEEFKLAKKNNIKIKAVWLWIDKQSDSINALGKINERVFEKLKEAKYHGEVWLSFNPNYFEHLHDSIALKKGIAMVSYINNRVNALGCKLALYNHGDWFGEPKNQINIIKGIKKKNIGMVYNLHHAHHQLKYIDNAITAMLPYLWHVNLNGLREEGPKILPIGKGNMEKRIIETLIKQGYRGDYGVLGHQENADVKKILLENLKGLKDLMENKITTSK